jgi:hypothetical protein
MILVTLGVDFWGWEWRNYRKCTGFTVTFIAESYSRIATFIYFNNIFKMSMLILNLCTKGENFHVAYLYGANVVYLR